MEAIQCLEEGTQKLEEGDVQGAKVPPKFHAVTNLTRSNATFNTQASYQRSVDIKRTASALFNLGVTYYHLSVISAFLYILV